jgi:TP901 family phage tail tape measure protein
MAQKFNLTAQLQLQANQSNINQVVSQVQKQLAPLGNIKLKAIIDGRSLAQANQQMGQFNKYAQSSTKSVGELNRTLAESARRFSVITVATGSLLSLVNAFKKSTSAAIDFEYEMVKISQTTGQTMREVSGTSDEIRKLSSSLGVSSAQLAGTARILLQAGLSADKTKKSLDILAKTTLAASFDDLQSTTEGAISLINQFRGEAARAGGDVKFLEQSLDSINAVSKAFAVESADLVDVISKVGGVFSNAGGSVNELIALFTSVRATTRESAETIGTGLRTIFTRIQRGDTVDALKELGVELRNSEGQFVGAFEAVKRLSEGLSSLDPRDFRFSAIVEELGGYRQIGKVIPLINQFSVAQQALNVAQNASGSIAADAQTSQQALAVQINKTKEKFNEFIASLVDSGSFRSIISGALKLADAMISIGKALEPVLPLLTTLFALKAGQGLASGIGILRGFAGAPSGIRASKFASGGMVPGTGNRDTVPAMLMPGEFVIRKSSVNKIGAGTLAQMNANGYMAGGIVTGKRALYGDKGNWQSVQSVYREQNINLSDRDAQKIANNPNLADGIIKKKYTTQQASQEIKKTEEAKGEGSTKKGPRFKVLPGQIGGFILQPSQGQDDIYRPKSNPTFQYKDGTTATLDTSAGFPTFYPGGRGIANGKTLKAAAYSRILDAGSKLGIKAGIENTVSLVKSAKLLDVNPAIDTDESLMKKVSGNLLKDQQIISTMSGYLFEGMIGALSGAIPAGGRSGFDFPSSSIGANKTKLETLFENKAIQNLVKAEAKRSRGQFTGADGVINKTINDINAGNLEGVQKFNKGSSGTGVKPSNYPLVDDILENAKGAILPNPKNIEDIIKAGGGALDVDRTLIRTIGDKAYAQAKTEKAKEEVLKKYFVGAGRLQDIKSSPLTQFGKTLQSAIQSGQINPNNLKIITKSRRVDGVGEYLNQLFGIPLANMIFTQGGSKQPALDAFNTKGSRAQRVVKRASGGGISGSDTVPAMLTPGEFVVSKSAAQSIGYTNLNRMNKHGVTGYASGGVVGVQKFATGGTVQSTIEQLSSKDYVLLEAAVKKNAQVFDRLATELDNITDDPKIVEAALKAFTRNIDKISDGSELIDRSLQAAARQIDKGMGNATAAMNDQAARRAEQQAANQQRKDLGVKETRVAGSVNTGVYAAGLNQVEKDSLYAAGMLKAVGMQGQQLQDSFARYKKFVNLGWTSQDALNQVIQNTTVEVKKQASLASRAKGGLDAATGGKQNREDFANRTSQIGGAMQNFVFLGASAAALAAQFSGLDAVTTQAITETAGFTTALVGIVGTTTQMVTSFLTNTVATVANTGATEAETVAKVQNASAGSRAAAAFGVVSFAVIAVISALKFLSARSKAQADTIEKERKARLAAVAETGKSDFAAGELQKSIDSELAAREYTAEIFKTSTVAAALSITAGGALLGASIGSSVPVFGTAIGAVIGAIGGFGLAMLSADAAVENANTARQKEVQSILEVYEANIKLSEASFQLNSALSSIESAQGLQGPEKIKRRLEAQEIGAGLAIQTAQKIRPKISEDAAALGLKESELKALTPDEIRAKASDRGLSETTTEGIALRAQASFETLKIASDIAATRVQETGKTLQDASQSLSFADTTAARESVLLFKQATDAARKAIEEEQSVKLSGATTDEQRNLITQQTNSRLKAFDAGIAASEKAKISEIEAVKRAAAAQLVMAESARKTAVFLNSLADQENSIKAQSDALKDFTDALSGNAADLSNAIKPIINIEDPSKVTDRSRFASDIQTVARTSKDPEAIKFANQLTNAADIFAKANETLLNKTLDLGESINAEQILKNIGLTSETFGGGDAGKKVLDDIAAELTKAAGENPVITEDLLQNILSPLSQQSKDAADVINKLQSTQQQELNLRQQQLQAEQSLRERQLSDIDKYNNVVASGAEILARANNKSVAAARLRVEQESRQRKLNAGQVSRGGIALDATNIQQLGQVKKLTDERIVQVTKEISDLKNRSTLDQTSQQRLSDLLRVQQELINTSKDASDALQEIANSSAEIDKLTESLDKERNAREQAFGVLKDLVAGGQQSRQDFLLARQGILSAIQTGTTQNLPEEIRASVFGLLDKLSDVQIAGTGLTGKQLSTELVVRDLVNFFGVDKKTAIELATQTTTEEKILQQLELQTKLMANAQLMSETKPVTKFSEGGAVYRANGGSIFKPRGTDTIPAMLTPGEFVVNAKATDKNLGLLQAINSGESLGATQYASKGGKIRYLKDGSKKPVFPGLAALSRRYDETGSIFPKILGDSEKKYPGFFDLMKKGENALGTSRSLAKNAISSVKSQPIFMGMENRNPDPKNLEIEAAKIASLGPTAPKQYTRSSGEVYQGLAEEVVAGKMKFEEAFKRSEDYARRGSFGFLNPDYDQVGLANRIQAIKDFKNQQSEENPFKDVAKSFEDMTYKTPFQKEKEKLGTISGYRTTNELVAGRRGINGEIFANNERTEILATPENLENARLLNIIQQAKSQKQEAIPEDYFIKATLESEKRIQAMKQQSLDSSKEKFQSIGANISSAVDTVGGAINDIGGGVASVASSVSSSYSSTQKKLTEKKAAEVRISEKRKQLALDRKAKRDKFKQLKKQNSFLNINNAVTVDSSNTSETEIDPMIEAQAGQELYSNFVAQSEREPSYFEFEQIKLMAKQKAEQMVLQKKNFQDMAIQQQQNLQDSRENPAGMTREQRYMLRMQAKQARYNSRASAQNARYEARGFYPSYYSSGGVAGQEDTIPAMLNAGEFVVNKNAVQKYGINYMDSLNKGKVPGFKRGGLVGGVNYLQNGGQATGGGVSFNFGALQAIFDTFSDNFQNNIDNIITAFSTIGGSINSLVAALSAGMTVTHQFSGDMTLAFNIQNGDVLKNQIAEAITPKLKEIITQELDSRLNNFKAGG